MDTDALEKILSGGMETQRIDFKASCPWGEDRYARHILALSNVQDGGYIIIGVREEADGSYTRTGVTDTDRQTYQIDIMKDQMAKYADPHVSFAVSFPSDNNGVQYAAIEVFPFEVIPVLCIKQSSGTKESTIYYRNRTGRIQSAAVSNSYDMRDILDRASILLMRRMKAGHDPAFPPFGCESQVVA